MKTPTTQAGDFWRKTAGPQLKAAMVQDLGCRLEYDKQLDANRDVIAFTDRRAVIRAKLVNHDIMLSVDVEGDPEQRGLDGLSVTTFEGLNEDATGEAVAVFRNGRALRLMAYKTTPITDPAELTARELKHARIRATAPTTAAAKPEAKKRRKVNRNGGMKPTPATVEILKQTKANLARNRTVAGYNEGRAIKAAIRDYEQTHGTGTAPGEPAIRKHLRKERNATGTKASRM